MIDSIYPKNVFWLLFIVDLLSGNNNGLLFLHKPHFRCMSICGKADKMLNLRYEDNGNVRDGEVRVHRQRV